MEVAEPAAAGRSSNERLVEALLQATTKKPTALEHIDMAAELARLGLDVHFLIASWPLTNATRKLATENVLPPESWCAQTVHCG